MYKTDWLEEDRQRVMNMERWYILDGRHRPDHPQHGIYTGLSEKANDLDSFVGIVCLPSLQRTKKATS